MQFKYLIGSNYLRNMKPKTLIIHVVYNVKLKEMEHNTNVSYQTKNVKSAQNKFKINKWQNIINSNKKKQKKNILYLKLFIPNPEIQILLSYF